NKDLKLVFENVILDMVTPELERFKIDGTLNGEISVRQNNDAYRPSSSLTVDSLIVNDLALGDLNIDVTGDENFSKFKVSSTLLNKNVESFKAAGDFSVISGQTDMNVDVRFKDFHLGTLNGLLAGDAISDIKGFV